MKVQKNTPFIPYKKENKKFAQWNRLHPTPAENIKREEILKHKPLWYKFTRQKPLEAFIADFYCTELMLVIEVDGDSHIWRWTYDIIRESKLAEYWIEVIRYTNSEVFTNIDWVKERLEISVCDREKVLKKWKINPNPC